MYFHGCGRRGHWYWVLESTGDFETSSVEKVVLIALAIGPCLGKVNIYVIVRQVTRSNGRTLGFLVKSACLLDCLLACLRACLFVC